MATIERTFDRRSKTVKADWAAFEAEVRALEVQVAPASLITHVARDGDRLHVTVLSALVAAPAASSSSLEPWTPW